MRASRNLIRVITCANPSTKLEKDGPRTFGQRRIKELEYILRGCVCGAGMRVVPRAHGWHARPRLGCAALRNLLRARGTRVLISLWDSLMFGRVPKNGVAFLGTRPNISESHSEISTRVPFCITQGPGTHRASLWVDGGAVMATGRMAQKQAREAS